LPLLPHHPTLSHADKASTDEKLVASILLVDAILTFAAATIATTAAKPKSSSYYFKI